MTEEAQEAVEASVVDTAPVPNEAETKTEEVETEAEETESNDSPEAETESEPEKTVEERLAEIETDVQTKQKAIDRKTAAYSSLQKAHEKTLQELREAQAAQQAEEPLTEPVIDDFETHADYITAVKEHERNVAKQEAKEEIRQEQLTRQAQALAQERVSVVNKQESEYVAQNPDYIASKAEFEGFVKVAGIPAEVEKAIVDQAFEGHVPHLIDYFGRNGGENLDKLQEIAALSPTKAAVEIYKVQQALKTPEKTEIKPAAAPVKKPKGGGKPRKDINTMSGDEVLKQLGFK